MRWNLSSCSFEQKRNARVFLLGSSIANMVITRIKDEAKAWSLVGAIFLKCNPERVGSL
jgi:mannitol-specific phosphotransferase system IIBC component